MVTRLTLTPTPVVAQIQDCVAAYGVRNARRGYQQTSARSVVLTPSLLFSKKHLGKPPEYPELGPLGHSLHLRGRLAEWLRVQIPELDLKPLVHYSCVTPDKPLYLSVPWFFPL